MLIDGATPSIKYFSNHTGLFYYLGEQARWGWQSGAFLSSKLISVGKKKIENQEKDIRDFRDAM